MVMMEGGEGSKWGEPNGINGIPASRKQQERQDGDEEGATDGRRDGEEGAGRGCAFPARCASGAGAAGGAGRRCRVSWLPFKGWSSLTCSHSLSLSHSHSTSYSLIAHLHCDTLTFYERLLRRTNSHIALAPGISQP